MNGDKQLTLLIPDQVIVKPMANNKKLIIYAFGIFICYFYFGILQEKM